MWKGFIGLYYEGIIKFNNDLKIALSNAKELYRFDYKPL
jgi:hypothetical protein